MKQIIEKISLKTKGENIFEFTPLILDLVNTKKLCNGLINLSILHTSCSLLIQENADNTVIEDIKVYLNDLAPKNGKYFHNTEGSDDMPAHLKTMLTQTNLTLSIQNKKLILGNWQGIFLLEHRDLGRIREIIFHYIGD
tara:strand:- start:616 stop:1032 length:417 start_codon:yes stop_codon:yes gene_type:complete